MTYIPPDHAATAAALKQARAQLAGTSAALRLVTAQRDRARRIAVTLEQENAVLEQQLANVLRAIAEHTAAPTEPDA